MKINYPFRLNYPDQLHSLWVTVHDRASKFIFMCNDAKVKGLKTLREKNSNPDLHCVKFMFWIPWIEYFQWWYASPAVTPRTLLWHSKSTKTASNQVSLCNTIFFALLFGMEGICRVLPSCTQGWTPFFFHCRCKISSSGGKKNYGRIVPWTVRGKLLKTEQPQLTSSTLLTSMKSVLLGRGLLPLPAWLGPGDWLSPHGRTRRWQRQRHLWRVDS